MLKLLKYLLAISLSLILGLFWLAYLSPRPPLTIDPETLAGDGSTLNYCELPALDSTGLLRWISPKETRQTAPTIISHCPYCEIAQSHYRRAQMTSAGSGAQLAAHARVTWKEWSNAGSELLSPQPESSTTMVLIARGDSIRMTRRDVCCLPRVIENTACAHQLR